MSKNFVLNELEMHDNQWGNLKPKIIISSSNMLFPFIVYLSSSINLVSTMLENFQIFRIGILCVSSGENLIRNCCNSTTFPYSLSLCVCTQSNSNECHIMCTEDQVMYLSFDARDSKSETPLYMKLRNFIFVFFFEW